MPGTDWTPALAGATAAILIVGWLLGWLGRSAELSMAGDDATYLAMSWSLQAGHYGELFFAGSPPHAQYPPLFPAWLLGVRTLFGSGLGAIFAANLALHGLTVFLLVDGARRLRLSWLGVSAAAAAMWNPDLLRLSGEVMSESLFIALGVLALWASLRTSQGAGRRYGLLAVAAALCAFLTRTAGIALLPAILGGFLWRRQWRDLAAGTVAVGSAVVAWFAYTRWASTVTVGHSYGADLAAAPLGMLARILHNARSYFLRVPDTLALPEVAGTGLDNLVLGLLIVVPAVVGLLTLIRRWPAVPIFLCGSAAILLYFPWMVSRFMAPLIPATVLASVIGAAELARRAGVRSPMRPALGYGAVIAIFGLAGSANAVQRSVACRTLAPYQDARCYDPEARSYHAALQFIQDSLPGDAVVATSKPSTVYILTHHRTVPLSRIAGRPPEEVFTEPGGPTHLLLGRLLSPSILEVAPTLVSECSRLSLVALFPPGTLILRQRAAGEIGGEACAALEAYRRLPLPTFDVAPE